MKSNDFYQQTIAKYQDQIQLALNKKFTNLKPSRDYNFDHNTAYEALNAINKINDKHNTNFFLVAGGLLGLAREGKLLDHDYDLDIGYFMDEYSDEEIKNIFDQETNFSFLSSSNGTIVIAYKDLIIDLFGHYAHDESTIRFSTDIHHWDHKKFELKKVDFMNTQVLVPVDIDTYLTEEYGGWKNKIIAYDFSYDSPNRKYSGLPGVIYLMNRLENAVKNGWDSYASMAVSALYRNYNIDYRHIFPIPVTNHPAESIKDESTIYVTNSHTFSTDLLKKLKQYYDPEKNLIVILVGKTEITQKLQKILSKLSFTTQVLAYEIFEEEIIKKLYPNSKVIQDV